MAISQSKAIVRLYNEIIANGSVVDEDETIENITDICEKKGQFIFHVDSYWSFVKSKCNGVNCIRMIFALKETSPSGSGKVYNIDRILELIRNIEKTLIYVDDTKIIKRSGFIYLDMIKILDD